MPLSVSTVESTCIPPPGFSWSTPFETFAPIEAWRQGPRGRVSPEARTLTYIFVAVFAVAPTKRSDACGAAARTRPGEAVAFPGPGGQVAALAQIRSLHPSPEGGERSAFKNTVKMVLLWLTLISLNGLSDGLDTNQRW